MSVCISLSLSTSIYLSIFSFHYKHWCHLRSSLSSGYLLELLKAQERQPCIQSTVSLYFHGVFNLSFLLPFNFEFLVSACLSLSPTLSLPLSLFLSHTITCNLTMPNYNSLCMHKEEKIFLVVLRRMASARFRSVELQSQLVSPEQGNVLNSSIFAGRIHLDYNLKP